MAIEFKIKMDSKSDQLMTWTITDADLAHLKTKFLGLDVERELHNCRTKINEGRCRRPTRRGFQKFYTDWLRRSDKTKGEMSLARAREILGKSEWERRGITEEEWQKEQARKFYQSKQEKLAIHQRETSETIQTGLRSMSAELRKLAIQPPPIPNAIVHQTECDHENQFFGNRIVCFRCGAFAHQILADQEFIRQQAGA